MREAAVLVGMDTDDALKSKGTPNIWFELETHTNMMTNRGMIGRGGACSRQCTTQCFQRMQH
eukprot:4059863-Amphidinium_carterae.2